MGVCPSCARESPSSEFAFCPWCAAPLARAESSQRKTVTILFADLVGSTELGAALDPEVLREVLSSYWDIARAAVERHGGRVEKFIGDAVVGVFGIPVVHEDDAVRALRAASELRAGLRELNVGLKQWVGVELAARVGVNTGTVMVGDPAGDVSLLAGDAANVGARLEQAAGAGEVLMGDTTYRLARFAVDAEALPPLTVKGKVRPITAFRLLGDLVASGQTRGRRFSAPLVGRHRELRLARTSYETAVEERACVLLTVVGAPGVGKSRLVEELLAEIRSEALVLEGRCLAYGDGITYWPLVQMVQALTDSGLPPMSELLAGVDHADEVAAGLSTLTGRSSASTAGEIAWAFRRLVESLARRQPVVVVVDDVQWAEPSLLDLLDHLADLSRDAAILVVCMARPEFRHSRPTWGASRRHAVTTALAPLSHDDSVELTVDLLGSDVHADLVDRVTSAAEGVPLFVEEFVAMLADQGHLQALPGGGWRIVGDLGTVMVPPSVQALLAARLDRLPAGQRAVVDAASVIGKTFYPDAVAILLDRDADVVDAVEALVRSDFVRPAHSDLVGHDAYSFSHLLIRDAAYETVPKARRAQAHEAFARWLDRTTDGTATPELVVSHLQRSVAYRTELGDPDEALAEEAAARLLGCSARARVQEDLTAATGLLEAAAALVAVDSPTGVAVALSRAEAGYWVGDFAVADRWAERAERAAARRRDDQGVWRARLLRCTIDIATDPALDVDAAAALTVSAIEALTALGDDNAVAEARLLRCEVHNIIGRPSAARADAWDGLMAARRAGNLSLVSNLMSYLLMSFWGSVATLADEERLLADVEREFGDEPLLAPQIAASRVWLRVHQGAIEQGIAYTRDRSMLALEQGNRSRAAMLLNGLTWCQFWSGDLLGAVESLTAAARIREGTGEVSVRSSDLAMLAMMQAWLGRESEAAAVLEQSRRLGNPQDVLNPILEATAEGLLWARRGDPARSDARFDEGLRRVLDTDFAERGVELLLVKSVAREILGDPAGALAAARAALAAAERQGFVPPVRLLGVRVAECEEMVRKPRAYE